ncbi:hypothetical protein Cpap_1882 [Ruminiclostridium papyrosolvens DSM 2782]|uniref:DUF4367 domain-containing protein n=1 Tax=Ruminiclostridium papyrosolvens DSM 2782 TaxID=588581 RepID=F1TE60_9FIRM|nr:DUF4367 domain-containing protein [Ruminiclostridium papyrosolvens]EGD47300.1 hypothetical protein Cpap_1882 [Ruminiclostridium papyrosolvens DSM 2782]WES34646.1 DUF4367 domain-containing protein [Ruminiclostridium papyrosolvens DSM 2782]
MSSPKTLQDVLISVSKDTQKNLSSELDTYTYPLHKFSRSYAKRKKLILKSHDEFLSVYGFRKRILIPLVIIITILTCAMSVPAIREPVITFIVNVYNEMTDFIIRSDSNENQVVINDFALNYVPENYTLQDTRTTASIKTEAYKDNSGHSFSFTLEYYNKGINFSMDTEDSKVTETQVQGMKAVISEKNGCVNIAVFDNNSHQIWNLTGNIDCDVALKIVHNVKIK